MSYYLFIAVVDEALDGDNLELGKSILDMFDQPGRSIALRTDVAVITKILQRQTTRKNRDLISRRLHELYREVLNERLTRSISSYIDCRKAVGRRTAELSYLLIEDLLEGESAAALILMERVGQVGCLVDSVIDLNIDVGLGLLGFTPCLSDRFRLIGRCFWEGALILSRYPALAKLFVAAIADNVRDRTRMRLAGRSNLTLEPNEDFRSVAS